MNIAAAQGQTTPRDKILMSTETSSFRSFATSLKKISLKSDFVQFLHDLIHLYSHGAGADNPLGMKF